MTQQQSRERSEPSAVPPAPARAVERHGLDAVPEDERHGTARSLFWPWAASGLSLLGIAYGIYLMGLGLSPVQALVTGTVGYSSPSCWSV
ncbi:hypothetical protein [Streptomyces sp. NPDC020742]|uniref:hypothetical protein n=1 Tax=Streptomyces sp. NPDC020742 TaxID=3154897 RepID=UPI0033CC945B